MPPAAPASFPPGPDAPDPSRRAAERLPELAELRRLVEAGAPLLRWHEALEVQAHGTRWPVPVVTLGSSAPACPALVVVAGVHGLERIGVAVALAFVRHLVGRLRWDESLHHLLCRLHLVVMPLVNPAGVWAGTRANPAGVDLMRNAPVDALERVSPLVGGHRLTPRLPWYRGAAGAPMQPEALALLDTVRAQTAGRPFVMVVDCHSGFGLHDRLWFPYAGTRQPFPWLPEVWRLRQVLRETHEHHRYVIEPQSRQYLTHGDLWDHLTRERLAEAPQQVLLGLTLEMGSWLWVKKNPRQLFSRHGLFNPLIRHRQDRVLRRHVGLLDFLARAAASHARWVPPAPERDTLARAALAHWWPQWPPADPWRRAGGG